jgi:hypothetical protein
MRLQDVRGHREVVCNARGQPTFGLSIAEVVQVKSEREILGTLDECGELDGLPFMPEMHKFCGQRFTVYRRAHRLCDTATQTGYSPDGTGGASRGHLL